MIIIITNNRITSSSNNNMIIIIILFGLMMKLRLEVTSMFPTQQGLEPKSSARVSNCSLPETMCLPLN